jgi:hypothetical protein
MIALFVEQLEDPRSNQMLGQLAESIVKVAHLLGDAVDYPLGLRQLTFPFFPAFIRFYLGFREESPKLLYRRDILHNFRR